MQSRRYPGISSEKSILGRPRHYIRRPRWIQNCDFAASGGRSGRLRQDRYARIIAPAASLYIAGSVRHCRNTSGCCGTGVVWRTARRCRRSQQPHAGCPAGCRRKRKAVKAAQHEPGGSYHRNDARTSARCGAVPDGRREPRSQQFHWYVPEAEQQEWLAANQTIPAAKIMGGCRAGQGMMAW